MVRFAGLLVLSALCMGTLVVPTSSIAQEDNRRRALFKQYDTNGDRSVKGKEAKALRNDKPKVFNRLMDFCEDALERPKKNGMKFPEGSNPKKFKCKKSRIDGPYFRAWARQLAE